MYIYSVSNKISGKMYIGQTIQNPKVRFNRHVTSNSAIGKAIQKYGRGNFELLVVDQASSIEELNEKEVFWIKELNTKYPTGYNILEGGQIRLGPESISKMKKTKLQQKRKETAQETENRMKKIRKKIYCFETDTIYISIKEAASQLGIGSASNLAKYTRLEKPIKGYTFKFIHEENMRQTNNTTGGGLLLL